MCILFMKNDEENKAFLCSVLNSTYYVFLELEKF